MSLDVRRKTCSVTFLLKLINNDIDSTELVDKLVFRVPRLNIRRSLTFELETPRTNLKKKSPIFAMCSNYHKIQDNCDIFNTSKSEIKFVCARYLK